MVIFIWITSILIRHSKRKAAQKISPIKKQTVVRLMVSISGVMFLFGLTWCFAILTFSLPGLREAGSVLFTIFNSFQGSFIFLFFCVISKEARESWKELLSCGKYKSKLLHPSYVNKQNLSTGTTSSNVLKTNTMKSNTGTVSSGVDMYSPKSLKSFEGDFSMITESKIFEQSEYIPPESEAKLDHPVMVKPIHQKNSVFEADDIDTVDNVPIQSTFSGVDNRQETEKDKSSDHPLNVRVQRNPTLKHGKHDVELAEVDLHSSSSSDDGTHSY